ncbi:RES family NAD+ phosphorylase [Candidatus Poriferisodalis sp.]|uniref:RES family NAD+ phosphorylase n=1 Tax=Candidatus Poriferisodalis sp. TaxID=3101277 RepID=UPI003B02A604
MTADWRQFPTRTLRAGSSLHRIHRADRAADHYDTTDRHRFGAPPGHQRYGVCYLAPEPIAAYIEVFGRIGTLGTAEIDSRRISEATGARDLRLADLSHRSVLGRFGVTAAHSTGTDYTPSQQLSGRLHDAGHDGIVYRVRHDPQMQLEAVAVFARQPSPLNWHDPQPIPNSLVRQGQRFGIRVLPTLTLE